MNRKARSQLVCNGPLREEAAGYMERAGQSSDFIVAYYAIWPDQNESFPLMPCPACFIKKATRPLWLMPVIAAVQTAACRHCGLMLHAEVEA